MSRKRGLQVLPFWGTFYFFKHTKSLLSPHGIIIGCYSPLVITLDFSRAVKQQAEQTSSLRW